MKGPKTFPRRIHGIDFSGAADAGRKIWITSGVIEGGCLRIESCRRAETLDGSGKSRDKCFAALQDFIEKERTGIFGFDFPFGLPEELVKENKLVGKNRWEDFVLDFPEHYGNLEEFREKCCKSISGRELKRLTDRESKTPFSPYNLRVYRQTFYGIRDILHPLIQKACALPGRGDG